MKDIDLSKAIEELAESLADQYLVSSTKDAEDAIRNAVPRFLPQILEAYAGQAALEACTPRSYDDAVQKVATGLWLREKAEAARA